MILDLLEEWRCNKVNYHNISKDDMNNGDGIRVVLWVAGCEHHCPECQNPQTWDYNSGIPFDDSAILEIHHELNKDYISGITFSGGDPLAPENCKEVLRLIRYIKNCFPEKTIWVYTGYKYEQLMFEGKYAPTQILKAIDVLVDGRYKKDKRDVSLKWRGSKNQRVLDMKKTLETGRAVLWCD